MRSVRVCAPLLAMALASPAWPGGATRTPAALDGHWEGAIAIMGMNLAIRVDFKTGAQGLAATIDIPQQGAAALQLAKVSYRPPKLHFELPAGPGLATFDGEVDGDAIEGMFSQAGATGTFHLKRGGAAPTPTPAVPLPYREEEITYKTQDGTFAGTLTVPPGAGPYPAVVLITGSGPQNRDEEIFGFKPFRLIADHLSRHGIAVLRCDDRGVGGTTAKRESATTADLANDALGAVAFLKGRAEIDSKRIGLLGHSEGGVIAPIAAVRSADVAFIVLVSGMGVTGERVLLDQGELIGRAEGGSDADVAREAALQKRIFQAVRTGSGWEELTEATRKVALEQLGALPPERRQAIGDLGAYADKVVAGQLAMAKSPWFKYFIDYDPAPTLAKVRCPVLALFGEKDLQVPAETNRKAIVEALQSGGNHDVTAKILPGANHLYQQAANGSPSEYAKLDKEFVPDFLPTISTWISERTRPAR